MYSHALYFQDFQVLPLSHFQVLQWGVAVPITTTFNSTEGVVSMIIGAIFPPTGKLMKRELLKRLKSKERMKKGTKEGMSNMTLPAEAMTLIKEKLMTIEERVMTSETQASGPGLMKRSHLQL